MSAIDFNMLWKSIDVLETQEHISMVRAIMYPNLTKHARGEREKELNKAAYPRDIYKKPSKDVSYMLGHLNGGKRGR